MLFDSFADSRLAYLENTRRRNEKLISPDQRNCRAVDSQ